MASFRGDKFYLSNMYPCDVCINIAGVIYKLKSSEAVFQALKCPARINEFLNINGFDAKKLGKIVELRPDWNNVQLDIMRYALYYKFTQNPDLAKKLIAIEGDIVEYNEWHDTYWGVCNNVGENWLGRLLMELRDDLRK